MSEIERFGETPDGHPVERVTIEGGGLHACIITWGAVLQDLRMEGHAPPLVLGFDRFDHYPAHSPYFGAIAGRYANRIRDGRFNLDGDTFELDRNFLGRHHLHGGSRGTGKRVWSIADVGASHATLALTDRAGEMGYPGTVRIECTYRVAEGTLAVELFAVTDRATLCNLTHHSYFNLDDGGRSAILDHRLTIPADRFIPVDEEMIPTGEISHVEGTTFDFRVAREIRPGRSPEAMAYDHNWCLAPERRGELHRCARLESLRSGLSLEVWSGEPGIQFYAGHKLAVEPPGLDGIRYGAYAGLCLEPQVWPDSINNPGFPQAVLRPGERYRHLIEYRFARDRRRGE